MPPKTIFGTATFGMPSSHFHTPPSISSLFSLLSSLSITHLDTGARYPPLSHGLSESLVGSSSLPPSLLIDTKVFTDTRNDGSGDLTPSSISNSIEGSLTRLNRVSSGINILHIHRADPATPLRTQVRAFNEQIELGRCKGWGVSNVPIEVLREMLQICEEEGLRRPVCYQGEYNVITRGAEGELLGLLRREGVAFNAFRSLASGFMSGKFLKGEHEGTRFGDEDPLGPMAQKMFGAEDLHAAMRVFDDACTKQGLSTLEVAIRWIYYHSPLGEEDGVIIGASKEEQVRDTVAMSRKGPLPDVLVEAAETLWDSVKESRGGIM